jgi:hypothetical protein
MRYSRLKPKVLALTLSSILGVSLLLTGCANGNEPTTVVTAEPSETENTTNIAEKGGAEIINTKWEEAVGSDIPKPETFSPAVEWYMYDMENIFVITEKGYPASSLENYIQQLSNIDGITKLDPEENEEGFKAFTYQVNDIIIEIVIAPELPDDQVRSDTTVISYYSVPTYG